MEPEKPLVEAPAPLVLRQSASDMVVNIPRDQLLEKAVLGMRRADTNDNGKLSVKELRAPEANALYAAVGEALEQMRHDKDQGVYAATRVIDRDRKPLPLTVYNRSKSAVIADQSLVGFLAEVSSFKEIGRLAPEITKNFGELKLSDICKHSPLPCQNLPNGRIVVSKTVSSL